MSIFTGHSAFTAKSLTPLTSFKISQYAFNKWKKLYTWTSIQNSIPYGESFCEHFDIIDHQIYFTRDVDWINNHIKKYYIK